MSSSLINTFRVCFCAVCIVTVTFMVGYWVHKYQIEDRDIGVVDYKSFKEANEVDFPIPYLCFLDPFLKNKLNEIDLDINVGNLRRDESHLKEVCSRKNGVALK